jgi:hypothetical protein
MAAAFIMILITKLPNLFDQGLSRRSPEIKIDESSRGAYGVFCYTLEWYTQKREKGSLRWSRFVGQLGGLFKVYSDV